MKLNVRGKLFAVSVALMMGVGVISGTYLEFTLRGWLDNRAESDVWRQARIVRDAIELTPRFDSHARAQAVATRLAQSTGVRVTLIDVRGQVRADSAEQSGVAQAPENHLDREEVRGALQSGQGIARHFSHALRTGMLYAALPYDHNGELGVVRVAMSLDEVDRTVTKLRWMLGIAGLVGLGAAMFISAMASHYAARALRALVEHAQKIARGEDGAQLPAKADAFGRMAGELERVVLTLGRERDQFAAILESMSEAVLVVDAEQRISLINGAAIALLGTTQVQPLGNTLLDTVDSDDLRRLAAAASNGQGMADEFNVGARRVSARATPLNVSGGSVIVMHDITDLRHLERVRRDFVANVSHELRTPVSVIRANAETLLDGALDDPQAAKHFASALLRNAERLGRIIADLLDISRVEAGELRLRTQPVPLALAAKRAAELLEPASARKRVHVAVHIDEEFVASADAQALDQVLLNLLDNAVKYTPDGGHISVSAARSDAGQLRVTVCDDGPGLEAQHRKRVFERFYRVDSGRSRDVGGTGLGLSIVKHLCETMGGRVGVDALQPHGSVFWFTVPATAAKQEGACASSAA